MFGLEYRRGTAAGPKEVSDARDIETALATAQANAAKYRADNIRITDAEGREIGVYPVTGVSHD